MLNTSELDSLLEGDKQTAALPEPSVRLGRKARVAFVDLLFSWPPNGGADADLYNVIAGLQTWGYEVRLFGLHEEGSSDRGIFDPSAMPFPATRLAVTPRGLTADAVAEMIRDAVDAWSPQVVFIQHGFALKPHVTEALAHHRTVGRYYAHELACARDPLRFKDGRPCPNDFLRTPEVCRGCALEHLRAGILSWDFGTWTADYLAARAYAPEYHDLVTRSLRRLDAVIVSNAALKGHLEGFHDNVYIVPGGVHVNAVPVKDPPKRRPEDVKVILMTGRVDDPLKGLNVLLDACHRLARTRSDFEVRATHFDYSMSGSWFKAIGWTDYAGALALYANADIVAAPSIWDEPFGLVAVEAMAAGRPVVASRVGGLQEIVRHGETGLLFERGDSEGLAAWLSKLLDDGDLRARLGAEGRRVAEAHYDWTRIVTQRYVPLIERLLG